MSHAIKHSSLKRMYVEPRLPLYPGNGRACPLCHGSGHNCPGCSGREEEDESQFCECDLELTMEEIDRGRCAACGKEILA